MGMFEYLKDCTVPKYFLQSSEDVHGPQAALKAAFQTFAAPKSLEFIEASDHFFAGSLPDLEAAVAELPW
jgi:alpha/beta superfamily hydrolase